MIDLVLQDGSVLFPLVSFIFLIWSRFRERKPVGVNRLVFIATAAALLALLTSSIALDFHLYPAAEPVSRVKNLLVPFRGMAPQWLTALKGTCLFIPVFLYYAIKMHHSRFMGKNLRAAMIIAVVLGLAHVLLLVFRDLNGPMGNGLGDFLVLLRYWPILLLIPVVNMVFLPRNTYSDEEKYGGTRTIVVAELGYAAVLVAAAACSPWAVLTAALVYHPVYFLSIYFLIPVQYLLLKGATAAIVVAILGYAAVLAAAATWSPWVVLLAALFYFPVCFSIYSLIPVQMLLLSCGSEAAKWGVYELFSSAPNRYNSYRVKVYRKGLGGKFLGVRAASGISDAGKHHAEVTAKLIEDLGEDWEDRKVYAATLARLGEEKWVNLLDGGWRRLAEDGDPRAMRTLLRAFDRVEIYRSPGWSWQAEKNEKSRKRVEIATSIKELALHSLEARKILGSRRQEMESLKYDEYSDHSESATWDCEEKW